MNLEQEIDRLIEIALNEDVLQGDPTTNACVPADARSASNIVLKQASVVAGLPFLKKVFQKIDPKIEVTFFVNDGSFQKSGTIIGKVEGPTRGIVTGERTALNFLQHTCGVATITQEYVKRIAGYDCTILTTRRTLPGLRALEKYAMQMGGASIHRHGLNDRLIIKTNHIRFVEKTEKVENPIAYAFQLVREKHGNLPIEIEINHVDELNEALKTDAYAIILRNLLPNEIRECVIKTRKTNKKIYLDSGGTITLDTIRSYAETGVDGISLGSLVHEAESIDIRLSLL